MNTAQKSTFNIDADLKDLGARILSAQQKSHESRKAKNLFIWN